MKKITTTLLCICLSLLVGCTNPAKIVKDTIDPKPIIINSHDNLFQITAPSTWKATEKGKLNAEATLEATNLIKQCFFAAIMEPKTDFDADLSGFNQIVVENINSVFGITLGESKQVTIGKYNGYLNEFSATVESVKLHYFYYSIETENYYGQLIVWSTESKASTAKDELTKIANSFQEKTTTNQQQ